MRHNKHRHQLGVKKEHRIALMANMASSLFIHGKINTTLAKAKALRPFAEKIITLAKKAEASENTAAAVHYRRQAIAKIRNPKAVQILFNERVSEFADRSGGYTRIYKLGRRVGDAAEVALIELIDASDEGYSKPKKSKKAKSKSAKPKAKAEEAVAEEAEVVEEVTVEAEAKSEKEEAPAAEETKK
jgi:large subunit ribosomal protein L17